MYLMYFPASEPTSYQPLDLLLGEGGVPLGLIKVNLIEVKRRQGY